MFRKYLNGNLKNITLATVGTYFALFAPTHFTKKHPKERDDKTNHHGEMVVYTWNPKKINAEGDGQIGHQSALVRKKGVESFYISFWPSANAAKYIGILPFKFLGLGGKFSDIKHDIESEGREPDSILVIPNLNYEKMRHVYDEMHHNSKQGMLRYKFFCNTPSAFHLMNAFKHHHETARIDPFSGSDLDNEHHFNKGVQFKSANCTSIVRQIAEHGGYPKEPFQLLPWGSTPIGQHLGFKHIGAHEIQDAAEFHSLVEAAHQVGHLHREEDKDSGISRRKGI